MTDVNLDKSFLPLKGFLQILMRVEASETAIAVQQLIKDHATLNRSPDDKIENSIILLGNLGILDFADGTASVRVKIPTGQPGAQSFKDFLAHKLINWLKVQGIIADLAVALRFDPTNNSVWVSNMRIPWSLRNLSILLLETGVFYRELVSSADWKIFSDFAKDFLEEARGRNERIYLSGGFTIDQLQDSLEAKDESGRAAEEWVVSFERDRLEGHPLIDQVRRISEENVGAGYDIVSFSSKGILEHDRFIEVKSFLGKERFYWSQNEIETAQQLGESYFLYLVDMKTHERNEYTPHIICGPYSYFFESEHDDWGSEVDTYIFTRRSK